MKAVDILGISMLQNYEEMFKEAGVDVDLVVNPCQLGASEDEIVAAVGDADAVITQTTFHPFTRKVLASLSNCRLVQSIGVGYDRLDVDAATEFAILASNVPDASTEDVSDHTMGLVLACTRRIAQLNEVTRSGRWTSVADPHIAGDIWTKMSRLRGQTLGLVAFGRIPQAVVPKARGFGLRVIAYDPFLPSDVFQQLGVEPVDLETLLKESDIVSLHTPFTRETERLIGLDQLRKMKPTACLVNTARGAVIDHDALYTALTEGYISVAACDVTEPEPIPTESPLLKLDNFICTAHSAGISPDAMATLQRRPGEEVIRLARGEWPVGLLNPEVKEKYRQKWGPS